MKALSIKQPWASLILDHGKDIENRTWRTPYRGPLAIHAGLKPDLAWPGVELIAFLRNQGLSVEDVVRLHDAPLGGIIGVVELVNCSRGVSESPWAAEGQWHWELADPRPVPFVPMKGRLGLMEVEAIQVAHAMTTFAPNGLAVYKAPKGSIFHIVQMADDWRECRALCGLRPSRNWKRYSSSIWLADPAHRCLSCAGHTDAVDVLLNPAEGTEK